MLEINFDSKMNNNFDAELNEVNFSYRKGDYVGAFSKGVMLQEKMPENVILHNLVGASELALGDPKAAANSYARAIEIDPKFLGSYINLGSLYRSLNMNDEALSIYKIALGLDNTEPSLYYNIGNLLMDFKEHKMAQESFQEAIKFNPEHLDAHYNLALSLIDEWKRNNSLVSTLHDVKEKSDYSVELLERAKYHLEKSELGNRNNAEYYQLLAEIQLEQGDFKNSEKNSKISISIDTEFYDSYLNLARLKYRRRDFEGAVTLCETALKLKPKLHPAKIELGLAKFNLGQIGDTIKIFKDLVKSFPENNDIIYNLSLSLGAAEKYKDAWKLFSSRFKLGMDRENFEKFSIFPKWNGKRCESIAVWQEQGVGDVIFFASMLDDLANCVNRVSVFIDSRLIELFENSFPKIQFFDQSDVIAAGDFEAQVPMGDLPMFFRNKISDFPKSSFLTPPKEKKSEVRNLLKRKGNIICGLAWYTKASQRNDDRAIELDLLLKSFDGLDINLINLQYPVLSDKSSIVPKKLKKKVATIPGIDLMDDFAGMASLINECDLVVTIDSVIAHLASAIGKKTIVLLPSAPPNYRWTAEKPHTPWYPDTTLLLRKARVGDWSNVLNDLTEELRKICEKVIKG